MKNIKKYFALACCIGVAAANAQDPVSIAPSAQLTVHGGGISVWGNMRNSANGTQSGSLTVKDNARIIFYGDTWENSSADNIAGDSLLTGEVDFINPRPAPYGGAFAQTLNGGGDEESFPSVRISNPMNVNLLDNSTRVRGTLTFGADDGHIISNGNNLSIGDSLTKPGNIVGYGPLRYFVTNECGSGYLILNGFSGTAQVFPVGIAENDYTPVSVQPDMAAKRVSANVCNYANSASNELLLLGGGVNRTWNIFADASADASITLQHNSVTNNSGGGGLLTYTDPDGFIVQSTVAGVWQSYINPPFTFATGTLQDGGAPVAGSAMHTRSYTLSANRSSLSAFFTKDYSGLVLPVTGLQFTGGHDNGNVTLDWKVLSENNLAYYEVTRSFNGTEFNVLGRRQAANRQNASYTFIDNVQGLPGDKLYYRLRITDKDGRFRFSDIVLIQLKKRNVITIYPNPASSVINISMNVVTAQKAEMVLYNMHGQAVKRQAVNLLPGQQTVQLRGLEMLAEGRYELYMNLADGNSVRQRVIILH